MKPRASKAILIIESPSRCCNERPQPNWRVSRPSGKYSRAWNIPAADNLTADGRFADDTALHALYAPTGALEDGPVGVYCGAGVSAAHDVLALALLGIDAAMYPGSWSAWISNPVRPVVVGPERN